MSRFLKADGVVLGSRSFGEGHKMVTIFTDRAGKLDASAFGARRTRSRLASGLERFTSASFLLYRGKQDFPYSVREAEVTDSHTALRENLDKYLLGTAMVEPLLRFVESDQPDPELFGLVSEALRVLQEISPGRGTALLSMYDLRFLDLMGYRPDPDTCARCERPVAAGEPRGADCRFGFPLCPECASSAVPGADAFGASQAFGAFRGEAADGAVAFVRWALENHLTDAARVALKTGTARSVRRIVECLYTATFSRKPESWSQLEILEE